MKNKILNDLTQALKQGDKEKLSVLRMIKGSIQLEEIKLKRELNEEEIVSILSKEIKTRNESIKEFTKGNRQDLIDKTSREIEIIKPYLPEQLSTDEVLEIIETAFKEVNPTSSSDMGKIMKSVTPKLKGKTDMGNVSKIIKERLSNLAELVNKK